MIMNTKAITLAFLTILTATTVSAQPPFGGGDRGGGDRGGGDRGGGDRGGRGGSPFGGGDRGGGSRGGFDPSSFLDRLDANGNGVLDPDEQQGPAQFLIGRLTSMDPSIKSGSPIPVDKIKKAFEKMRGGGGDDSGRDSRGGGGGPSAADAALMPELLVPGFGEDVMADPLMGFGATAEMLAVPVTDDDRREASETMRRYDRNNNGFVDKNELSSRFSGNPMDFDRNRDGKLSLDELAVRYARRREGNEEAKKEKKREDRRERKADVEVPDVYGGRKSYRVGEARKSPEGVPGYFSDKDANGDGQVTMAEFTSEWDDEQVKAFFDSDFNRDGVITVDEAMRMVEQGPASAMASTGPSTATAAPATALPAGTKPDPKYIKYVQRIISRYDANKDGSLTPSEYGEMLMSPADADANRDGRISVDEYALWMQLKQKK